MTTLIAAENIRKGDAVEVERDTGMVRRIVEPEPVRRDKPPVQRRASNPPVRNTTDFERRMESVSWHHVFDAERGDEFAVVDGDKIIGHVRHRQGRYQGMTVGHTIVRTANGDTAVTFLEAIHAVVKHHDRRHG